MRIDSGRGVEAAIRIFQRITGNGLLPALAAFLLLALAVHFGVATERARQVQKDRDHVARVAFGHLAQLEGELNANVFLANGMVGHIIAERGELGPNVEAALQALFQYGRHLRNIAVAPGNRISTIYPLAGNQAALGLYYPEVPAQWPAVRQAIETRSTLLAGPVALRQGGVGLVSRTPVFLPDGRYWGIITLVLDADSLFRSVGLDGAASTEGVRYAIRGRDGLGKDGDVFYGDPDIFTQDAMAFDIRVPGGSWYLAALPAAGWGGGRLYLAWIEAVGLVAALALAAVVHLFQRNSRRVADSEKRLRAFLDTTRDGVIVIDEHGIIQVFNPAAESLFGYQAEEVLGNTVNMLMPRVYAAVHDKFIASPDQFGRRDMAGGRDVHGRRKDGSEFPIEVTVGVTHVGGRRMHVGILRDITERKAYERKLMDLATGDPLTGALNRRAFMDAAEEIFSLARRYGHPLSVLMIDADHFKAINDRHGHQMGDAVLVRLVQVVKACLRNTDRLGRFGGEEFVVLLPETNREDAIEIAERLLAVVRQQRVDDGQQQEVGFTISIGVAPLTLEMDTFDDLIRAADVAVYKAKGLGRDRWALAD